MAIPREEWLRVLEKDYLADFIPADGFTVKFAVTAEDGAPDLAARLESLADWHGFVWAPIDAAFTRLHMMHDVFFAIARRIDWTAIAQTFVESLLAAEGYEWPTPGRPAAFASVAERNDMAEHLLRRDVKKWLTAAIWDDFLLTQDFRAAMLRLCLKRFEPEASEDDPVLYWLTGDLPRISALKDVDIFSKITRTNARAMLASLCRWLAKAGGKGLLVYIDLGQLALKGAEAVTGIRYSKASVMDAYEVLRQLIDDAERYQRFAVVAAAPPSLLDGHEDRVIGQYQALQMRIWDDVRSRSRDNPVAPLVRLTA